MRSGYQIWNISLGDIQARTAGVATEYVVPANGKRIDAINVMGAAKNVGLAGKDFYFEDDNCIFKKDPTAFGTISVEGDDTILTLTCIGSPLQSMLEPLAIAFRQSADDAARRAINEILYSYSPMGVTQSLIAAVGGCHLSSDPLVQAWTEGDYDIGITDRGELVYAPTVLGLGFETGSAVDISKILSFRNIDTWQNTEVFCIKLQSGIYLIFPDSNPVATYPGLLQEHPELHVTAGMFSGVELMLLLEQKGCVFYRWDYIKSSGEAQKALSNYATISGKVVIDIVARGEDDLSGIQHSNSTNNPAAVGDFQDTAIAYNFI
jgi:hypothetical protein